MKKIEFTNKFKKHLKKVKSYPSFKVDKFNAVENALENDLSLDRVYDDHAASKSSPKSLKGRRILHLAPNICLIYNIIGDIIYFEDIGSHQDLGLTESLEDLVRANGSKYLNWLLKD